MREQYETAADLMLEAKDWGVLGLLATAQTPAQIPGILEEVFLEAAFHHDDETACQLFQWLMKAEKDAVLIPFLEEDDRGRKFLPHNLGPLSEEMRQVVRASVERAMNLYEVLPTFNDGTVWVLHSQGEGHHRQAQRPTLLKTKRYLLGIVAKWWCNTEDEKEADKLIEFLRAAQTKFKEEMEMLEEVIRNTTSSSFPVARLGRYIASPEPWGTPPYKKKAINNILILAWARNQDDDTVAMGTKVLLPLHEIAAQRAAAKGAMVSVSRAQPEAAFALLTTLSLQVAALDVQGEELMGLLQGRDGSLWHNRVRASYPTLDRIEVTVSFQKDGMPSSEDEALHGHFGRVKTEIGSWLERKRTEGPVLPLFVTLTFIREPRYSREEPETFRKVQI